MNLSLLEWNLPKNQERDIIVPSCKKNVSTKRCLKCVDGGKVYFRKRLRGNLQQISASDISTQRNVFFASNRKEFSLCYYALHQIQHLFLHVIQSNYFRKKEYDIMVQPGMKFAKSLRKFHYFRTVLAILYKYAALLSSHYLLYKEIQLCFSL